MTAIILLNWNGYQDTIECLGSLFACTKQDFVWVVADNGSENESVQEIISFLNESGKDFAVVQEGEKPTSPLKAGQGIVYCLKENHGFAKGNNLGIALVEQLAANEVSQKPSHYLLLNNDTLVEPDFLEKLETFSREHPQYVAMTPQIRLAKNRNLIWNCGGSLVFGLRIYRYENKPFSEIKEKHFMPISLITGCALFAKRELLGHPDARLRRKSKRYAQTPLSPTDDTDLLTNRFFFGEEDFDFSLRIQEEGKKMACVLDSIIYHKLGASREKSNQKEQIYSYYLNRFIDVRQHYSKVFFFFWIKLYSCYIKNLMVRNGIVQKEAAFLLRRLREEGFRKEGVSKEDFLKAHLEYPEPINL